MKPFQHEVAVQKIKSAFEENELTPKEQQEVLSAIHAKLKEQDSTSPSPAAVAMLAAQNAALSGLQRQKVREAEESLAALQLGLADAEATYALKNLAPHTPELQKSMAGLNYSINASKQLIRRMGRAGVSFSVPSPVSTNLSPGESFAELVKEEVKEFVLEQRLRGVMSLLEAQRAMRSFFAELFEKYQATPAQQRYLNEFYNLEMQTTFVDARTEWEMCGAWARAAEVLPRIRELIAEFERRIARIWWPPAVNSAATMEATLMAITYCWSTFMAKDVDEWVLVDPTLIGDLLGNLAANNNKLVENFINKITPIKDIGDLADFGLSWLDSNFSKLEVSHKLAASLCLTDVPDDLEVQAPWSAWSLVIPDGLLAVQEGDGFARVLCEGSRVRYLISTSGRCVGPICVNQSGAPDHVAALFKVLNSLVKGACLALSDPDQYKKKSLSGNEGSFKSKRVGGAPELNNARYMLSAPVQVDLRDVLHAVLRGEKRSSGKLSVQFLVRGHWKNQAHGPQHSLRKRIWLQPFWKGDENTRILLRNYIIKDEEQGNEKQREVGRQGSGGSAQGLLGGLKDDTKESGGKDGQTDV